MGQALKDTLDRSSPNTMADALRKLGFGTILRQSKTALRQKTPTANAALVRPQVSTLSGFELPDNAKGATILRAYARGGTPAELTVKLYGVTPATGEIAIAPNGDIVVLAADTLTGVDVVYEPEINAEVITLSLPCAASVLTIPAAYAARGIIYLIAATVTAGAVLGKKRVLIPGAAPATTLANLSVAKNTVLFNVATDLVTAATVTLLVAKEAAADPNLLLEDSDLG